MIHSVSVLLLHLPLYLHCSPFLYITIFITVYGNLVKYQLFLNTAEILGLILAIETITDLFGTKQQEPKDIVIFTDSFSTLKALENSDTSTQSIDNLALVIDQLLTSYDIKLTLQWIPGHCDLQGNEIADSLAKEGARKEQPDNPCSFSTLRRIMKGKSREAWLNRWRDGDTGRVMFNEIQEPNPKDDINSLSRKHQCAIFQLLVTHHHHHQIL